MIFDNINMVNKSMCDLTEIIGKRNILITNKNYSIGHVMCSVIWFIKLPIIQIIYLYKGLFYKKMLFWKLFTSDTS